MTPVIRQGQVGVGILANPPTADAMVVASNIWPGVFAFDTPLRRILARQVVGEFLGPARWDPR